VDNNTPEEQRHKEIIGKLQSIQKELEEAEGRDRVVVWIALMAVGATVVVASLAPQEWWAALGVVMLAIGGYGVWRRCSPW
jgi:Flp pilus assembly protein TadB